MPTSSTRIRAQLRVSAACADEVTAALVLAGLTPTTSAGVALLVTDFDDPGAADQWSVDSLPHLVVRLSGASVRVGPFVHPGMTACLRCLAAARPSSTAGDSGPGAGAERDPALWMVALGWAVRDLATWHAGDLPTTWSSTVTIGADLQPEITRWPRHLHCGCSWGVPTHQGAG